MNEDNEIEYQTTDAHKPGTAALEPGWNDFPDWFQVRAIVSDEQLEELERHREALASVLGVLSVHVEITTTLHV